jgi:hypothetical protein
MWVEKKQNKEEPLRRKGREVFMMWDEKYKTRKNRKGREVL